MRDLVTLALREPAALTELTLGEWDLLVRQARQVNLFARIGSILDDLGLIAMMPARPRAHLEAARVMAYKQQQAIRWEVRCIKRALVDTGVTIILLKGAAYVMAELPFASGRLFGDIDILVPKDKLPAVEAALMLHGWAVTKIDAYDQRYYRTWMHELPPLQHMKRQTVIDVHHAILPETARFHPDSASLIAAACTASGTDALKVLAPTDMILHSATHLFCGEIDKGLRDLADLDSLLRHFGTAPLFWETLGGRAITLDLSRPLFYALRYTKHILATPIPGSVLQSIKNPPGFILLYIMDALFTRAFRPDHASCRLPFTGFARWLLYVRAHWLRMPPWLLARHLWHKAFISPKIE